MDFTVLLHMVLLLLLQSHTGQLQVVGPSQPIVALVGDDVILPCHLEPAIDASDVRLEWARPDLNPGFVHVRVNGREYDALEQPSYRGRTSVSNDKLKHGDISLNVSNIKVSDEGTYRCLAPTLGGVAFIQLVVGSVSSPVISKMNRDSRAVVLQCESNGWYPEPEVSWLDGEGHVLSAGRTETVRGPDGLYNISSRVTVEKRHSNNFTCRVQQKDINQSRETHVYIPVLSGHVKWILAPGLLSVLLCAGLTIYRCTPRYRRVDEYLRSPLSDVHGPWDKQKEPRLLDSPPLTKDPQRGGTSGEETAANQVDPTEDKLEFSSE